MSPWLVAFLVVAAMGVALWLVSLPLRNASIVDIFWGLLFVAIAIVGFALGDGHHGRRLLVLGLAAAWGLRLAVHLAFRNLGHGEDHRYADMRARHGRPWWILSLPYVFLLQAALAWLVSLPVQAAMNLGSSSPLGWIDAAGGVVFLAGLVFETLADLQLKRFRRDPENRGRVLDHGLWRYSRHPNYFGDFLVWWGLGLVGVAAGAWWTLMGPVVMSFFLMRVSGVTLLEQTIHERRPEYARYQARTSAFFPMPPREP